MKTKAVILVGGLGTRLRPLTFSIPKPLLPVRERPILQIIIDQLRRSNITDLILATGYQAELIRAFCGDGSRFGVKISYVHETKPLGTAGPLSLVRKSLGQDELFILMNGDIFTRLDFKRFVEFGRKEKYDLLIGYTKYLYRSPFGVLSIVGNRVEGIVEKPCQEYMISGGVYCLRASSLELVPEDAFFTMPDLIRALIAQGRNVGAYHIQECWMGLENVDHFEEAVEKLNDAPSDDMTVGDSQPEERQPKPQRKVI